MFTVHVHTHVWVRFRGGLASEGVGEDGYGRHLEEVHVHVSWSVGLYCTKTEVVQTNLATVEPRLMRIPLVPSTCKAS